MTGASVHPTAVCGAPALEANISIGAFAFVDAGAVLGAGCVIGAHAVIGPGVLLGPGVRVAEAAVLVGGPGITTTIGSDAHIGANATVAPGAELGRGAVVEPGSVVSGGVPPNAVVGGHPARIVGYVGSGPVVSDRIVASREGTDPSRATHVPGVHLLPLQSAEDPRGTLAALEHAALPFRPERTFSVFDVPSEHLRGAHAHRVCWQFLVCLTGSLRCVVDDGRDRDEVELVGPSFGLLIPPMIWGTQYRYTRDAVLLALASHTYDADDYIRDYDTFLDEVRSA